MTEEQEFNGDPETNDVAAEAPVEEQEQTVDEQVAHWKDVAMRKTAEVENIRRRTTLEKQQVVEYANERLMGSLLTIIDDLYAAVESANSSPDVEALKKGVEMIYAKAMRIFEENGLSVVETNPGEEFNVDEHEALMHSPSTDIEEGHVIQVVQRGYRLRDKILRHAKVITSAGAPTDTEPGASNE